jgi:tryptophanyl-tRNA synthetase
METERRKRIFSGIQPTGQLHLGVYYGAMQNWVRLQYEYDCVYCIVDQHALTVEYDTALLQGRILDAACLYLASGLDPNNCILFVQSHVKEHTELTWYLSTIASLGQLERMTQFKDKAEQHGSANLGLLAYPVLMAADILLYKAEAVPVGEDQSQHLELTRDLVQRFNHHFGEIFPEPQTLLTPGKRIIGLDNQGKMSKSKPEHTSIFMTDPPDVVWAKVRPAVTDPARQRRTDPGDPHKCPIGLLHYALSSPQDISWVEHGDSRALRDVALTSRRRMGRAENGSRSGACDRGGDNGGSTRCNGVDAANLLGVREKTWTPTAPWPCQSDR